MRCKPLAVRAAVVTIACAGSSAAWAAPDAKGVWLNDSGRGAIEIKDCGDKLCGHVVWTRDATDASRGCGKQMIGDVAPSGDGVWDGGWVYSPDKKRRYDVELKPLADGTLRVTGYAGTRFFSKTMIWTKAPADLQRCDASKVEASGNPSDAPYGDASQAAAETQAPVESKAAVETKPTVESKAAAVTAPPAPAVKPLVTKPSVATAPAKSAAQALAAGEAAKPAAEPKLIEQPKQASVPPPKEPAKKEKAEPRVADAGDSGGNGPDSVEDLIDELDGKEFGDGYGIKKLPGGDCRLKVPYVTITVPCKK